MPVRVAAALLLGLALVGCGSDRDEPEGSPSPSRPAKTSAEATAQHGAARGEPAQQALTEFSCGRTDGRWRAQGVLTSPSGKSDYRVTVVVAPDDTRRSKARRAEVNGVKKGEPERFTIRNIPGGDDGSCRIQVLRLPR